jgi:hypothetical protein
VIEWDPAVLFALNGAEAMPDPLVATAIDAVKLENAPEAPEPGAENVTLMPANALPELFNTVTDGAIGNAVLTAALCGVVPALAVIAGTFVNENAALG